MLVGNRHPAGINIGRNVKVFEVLVATDFYVFFVFFNLFRGLKILRKTARPS